MYLKHFNKWRIMGDKFDLYHIYSSFTNIICSSSQPVHVKFILNFSNYTILFSLGVTFLSFISPNPNIGPKGMSVPLTYRAHSLKGQGDSLQA